MDSLHFARIGAVVVSAFALLPAQEQTSFEVASIKPSAPASHTETRRYPGGRFTATGVTLKALMQRAWDIKDFQISGGPGWVNSERFDVEAKALTAGTISGEQLAEMIRSLLKDRFQLQIHRETREMPIYSLAVGKTGPKLQPTTASSQTWSKGAGSLTGTKIPLSMLASDLLESQLSRVVTDNTGIAGEFDLQLSWASDGEAAADQTGPSLFTAIQEQLGLRLESAKGPVEIFVIDRAEKPSGN